MNRDASQANAPTSFIRIAIAALALSSAFTQALSAQDRPTQLSIDGAVGGGHGWGGGERVERGLIAGDLLVAIRFGGDTRQGFLAGLEASRDWQLNGDLLCLVRADSGCVPQYPGFAALNVVGGYQWRWFPALRVRVLGGPAYYTASFDHNTTTNHSLGVGARADVAVHLFRPVSATVAARGAWVPRIRGQSYAPSAMLIGLRLETGG
jgi:hypothetical protein